MAEAVHILAGQSPNIKHQACSRAMQIFAQKGGADLSIDGGMDVVMEVVQGEGELVAGGRALSRGARPEAGGLVKRGVPAPGQRVSQRGPGPGGGGRVQHYLDFLKQILL